MPVLQPFDLVEVPGVIMFPGKMLAGERRQPPKKFVGLEVVLWEREEQLSIKPRSRGPGTSGILSMFENDIAA